jgi:outer membrane lipoprotein LolB
MTGSDPEQLLRDRVGWDVPLAELGDWVRGLRAAGAKATVEYDAQNLPALIEQSGWKVEYRDWFSDRKPPLPRKVFATRGNARVRVAIESWALGSQ